MARPLSRAEREDRAPSVSVAHRPVRIEYDRVMQRWEMSVAIFRRAVESYNAVLSIRARVRRVPPVIVEVPSKPIPVNAPDGRSTPALESSALARLTRREVEVACLIMQGLTNRQIAEALVITHGTAANHVAHVLEKLNAANRTQVAVIVQRRESMAENDASVVFD
jgi:DNA-binding NarL/FixJ family response regulator